MDPTELDFRLMRSKAIPAALLLVFGSPAFAHAISMSFGDLTLDGRLAHAALRDSAYSGPRAHLDRAGWVFQRWPRGQAAEPKLRPGFGPELLRVQGGI